MITFKQRSLIGLAAIFAIASTQACGSDDPGPSTPAGGSTAAGGAAAGAAPAGGSPAAGAPAGGSAPVGGAPAGGAPAGGTGGGSAGAAGGSAGAAAGSGGAAAGSGSGGAAGGSAGGSAAGAGGGASTATYAAVKTIFSASCGTGQCHNAASMHTNFQTGELYTTLSTAIAATPAANECNGTTLITPGDAAGSFLVKVISNAMSSCKDAGADKMIPKMPYMCGSNPMCLSADKIKTISDWITAGAPH